MRDEDRDENWHALSNRADGYNITVISDEEDARISHRRAIKNVGAEGPPILRSALRAHLNGVNVYITEGAIVVTTQTLRP